MRKIYLVKCGLKYLLLVFNDSMLELNSVPLEWGVLSHIPRYSTIVNLAKPVKPEFLPPLVRNVYDIIQRLYRGFRIEEDVLNELPLLYGDTVLRMLGRIPRGKVATYGSFAKHVGISVRSAVKILVDNPYPLIYPCHRVVKSNLKVGGYLGSRKLWWIKAEILRKEGVVVDERGKIGKEHLFLL